jgi:N6-L-threonylcarbamoyladenine synthase
MSSVIRVLRNFVIKLELAVRISGVKKVAISGGVAANSALRAAIRSKKGHWDVYIPPVAHCTDNAAMIAAAGASAWLRGVRMDTIAPDPSLQL